MAKNKEQKEKELKVLEERFAKSKSVVFTQYLGLSVSDIQELRRLLRKEQCEMSVSKKTLIARMLEKGGLSKEKVDEMQGGTAVVFGYDDEIAPARILATFGKTHEAISFNGGVLENQFIDIEKVTALSVLPSKQELYAKLVGSINNPISGFVNVLGGTIRGLVQALNQIKEKKA